MKTNSAVFCFHSAFRMHRRPWTEFIVFSPKFQLLFAQLLGMANETWIKCLFEAAKIEYLNKLDGNEMTSQCMLLTNLTIRGKSN